VIPNPEKTLLPGQYAEVRLLLGSKSIALLVPEQAIQEYQGGSYVYIVGKDNKVESRDVVPGERYRGMTEIEKGLALGEQVIIEGLQKVKPGTLVQTKLAEFNDTSKEPIDPAQPIKK
jgi:RND family efflux transporter MFP subunit